MKKLVLALMCLMFIVSFASCGKKGIIYAVSDDGTYATVVGYTGKATDIVISDTYKGLPVRRIDCGAFFIQSELTSVTIPDSVTSIGSFAFAHCSGLTSVTIPDSVTAMEAGVFANCLSLTQINVDEKNQYYKSIDGNLYSKDGTRFIHYAPGKTENSFVIPDSVITIELCAFSGCSKLTNVTIPNSVTTICDGAFNDCSGLTSVTIPDSVTKIGDRALADSEVFNLEEIINIVDFISKMYHGTFSGCSGLTSVTIPDSVTIIDSSMFSGCSGLTSVTIPDSVTTICDRAFANCLGLTSVYYGGTAEDWANITSGSLNPELTIATHYYYSETEPTEEGNFWHYVDGEVAVW